MIAKRSDYRRRLLDPSPIELRLEDGRLVSVECGAWCGRCEYLVSGLRQAPFLPKCRLFDSPLRRIPGSLGVLRAFDCEMAERRAKEVEALAKEKADG